MTMGEKILMMRKAQGWSQEELAEQVSVTRQAVSRWESDSAKPDAGKIIALCDLFGVSADYLLRDRYPEEQTGDRSEERKTGTIAGTDWKKHAKKWFTWAAVAFGGITTLVMGVAYMSNPIAGYDVNGVFYNGFEGFLKFHDVELLCILAVAALFSGGTYLAVPWIGKLLE